MYYNASCPPSHEFLGGADRKPASTPVALGGRFSVTILHSITAEIAEIAEVILGVGAPIPVSALSALSAVND